MSEPTVEREWKIDRNASLKIDWSADGSQMSDCGALIQKEVGGVERPIEII